jgi:hypothetical protein
MGEAKIARRIGVLDVEDYGYLLEPSRIRES